MAQPPLHSEPLRRLRKVEGQIKGIQRMVEGRRYCIDMTMLQFQSRNNVPVPGVAVVAAFAFLFAINYCACEAFSADHAHSGPSQQHSPTGHHDEHAPTSQDQSDPCCATLQAVVLSPGTLQVASSTPTVLPSVVSRGAAITLRTQLVAVPSGLSPPVREPTPARPFYRTTFANHAPPARLA